MTAVNQAEAAPNVSLFQPKCVRTFLPSIKKDAFCTTCVLTPAGRTRVLYLGRLFDVGHTRVVIHRHDASLLGGEVQRETVLQEKVVLETESEVISGSSVTGCV